MRNPASCAGDEKRMNQAAAIPGKVRAAWTGRPSFYQLPLALYLAVFYVFPLACLVYWSFADPAPTLQNYAIAVGPSYIKAFSNTLTISALVTLFTLLLGYPLAYALTLAGPVTKAVLLSAVMLPFWTSILVRSFAWVIILGNNGLANKSALALGLVEHPIPLIYNAVGVQIAMVHVMLPMMVLPLYAVFTRINVSLLSAARSLGASPGRAFARVFLPLSMPGVAAGSSLVFLLSVGFYITPALVGGRGEITIATLIDMAVNELLNVGVGSALAVILLLGVGAIYIAGSRFSNQSSFDQSHR